jgi:hypothetical protein
VEGDKLAVEGVEAVEMQPPGAGSDSEELWSKI